ncbi:MAG: NADH-quinone oxidoreductase subunit NuoE family protein [Acidiferrobacter sp.]
MSLPTSTADDPIDATLLQELQKTVLASRNTAAAISDVLRRLQQARGYIDDTALEHAAHLTGLTPTRVEELCTFYSLVLRAPAGRQVVRICDSIVCLMAGADTLLATAEAVTGVPLGTPSASGALTVLPHVCLGLCDRAPAVLVGDTAVGPLPLTDLTTLLQRLEEGTWRPS